MQLSDLCVSRELAKELKENGYPQDSIFKYCGGHTMYWENEDGEFEECKNPDLLGEDEYCHTAELTCEFTIAAPTAAELGEQLPETLIADEGMKFDLDIWKTEGHWHIAYWWDEDSRRLSNMKIEMISGKSLTEIVAKMWLYLKQNNLLPTSGETN